jgi:hypothetical protein
MTLYKHLQVPQHTLISEKLYWYIKDCTQVLEEKQFWNDLSVEDVLIAVPELKEYVDSQHLEIAQISAIYVEPNTQDNIHIDFNTDIRILWPVKNCEGSYTRFFNIDPKNVQTRRLSNGVWYKRISQKPPYTQIGEVEVISPILFNPGVAHSVITNPKCNDSRLTVTIRFTTSIDHLLQ